MSDSATSIILVTLTAIVFLGTAAVLVAALAGASYMWPSAGVGLVASAGCHTLAIHERRTR